MMCQTVDALGSAQFGIDPRVRRPEGGEHNPANPPKSISINRPKTEWLASLGPMRQQHGCPKSIVPAHIVDLNVSLWID